MPKSNSNFYPRDSRRGPWHPLLAAEPKAACQAVTGARREAHHDPADSRPPAATGFAESLAGSSPTKTCGVRSFVKFPRLRKPQIIAEPVGRNTAPAIGLAAFILLRDNPAAVIGMFPSDQVIGNETLYRRVLQKALGIAAAGENIVVIGVPPTRAETGYGYIEAGVARSDGALQVRRFTEKPSAERAAEFFRAGNYYWNSGMFLWSARTLANALREYLPDTAHILEEIAAAFGTRKFAQVFRRLYPGARISALTMPFSSHVRPKASRIQVFYVFPPASAGTIWAHGRRCMSTMSPNRNHNMTT